MGHRIAWAQVGQGPPLVMPCPWLSDVHNDWAIPEYRRFIELLSTDRTVIRYDRPGTGMSDRELPEQPSLEFDVRVLEGLLAEIECGPVDLIGISSGAAVSLGFASRNPEATRSVVIYGGYLDGSELATPEVQESLVSVLRANWNMGARMLSDVFMPGATEGERNVWIAQHKDSADPETAAELYRLVYGYDAREYARHLSGPALVIHRRGDRAVDFERGRELAATLGDAEFIPLDGSFHLPWYGDSQLVAETTLDFIGRHSRTERPAPPPTDSPDLTAREIEVLRLIADGLSDQKIAEELVLSPHTVHRHVANIRFKLGQTSRAAAAAQAARIGLI